MQITRHSHRATFILSERVLISDDARSTTTDRTGSSHLPGNGQTFDETDPTCSFTRAADVRKSFRRNRPRAPLFQTFAETEGDEEVSPSNIRSSTDVTSGIPKFSSTNIPNGHPTDVRENGTKQTVPNGRSPKPKHAAILFKQYWWRPRFHANQEW